MSPESPSDPIFLLVAGMPCAGKSTALRTAIAGRLSLFGEPADHILWATRIPEVFPEDRLTLDERLQAKVWVHQIDLFRMRQRNQWFSQHVVHFDLLSFLSGAYRSHAENVGQIRSSDEVLEMLEHGWLIRRLFGLLHFLLPLRSRILVHTLRPCYEELRDRWTERVRRGDHSQVASPDQFWLCQQIYGQDPEGRLICDNIHSAWEESVRADAC